MAICFILTSEKFPLGQFGINQHGCSMTRRDTEVEAMAEEDPQYKEKPKPPPLRCSEHPEAGVYRGIDPAGRKATVVCYCRACGRALGVIGHLNAESGPGR